MKNWILMLIILLLLTGCASAEAQPTTIETTVAVSETTLAATEETVAETELQEERFLLTFVGDCTFGSNPTNAFAG